MMNQQNGTNSNNRPAAASEAKSELEKLYPQPSNKNLKYTHNSKFEQPVILRQSPMWSRAIVWGIIGVTTFSFVWASVVKIEEAIPAQGKLEPQGAVKEIQAPVGGVVRTIHVEDGQRVKQGELLLSLDTTAAQAQKNSLDNISQALIQENQFYRTILNGQNSPARIEQAIAQLNLPPEIASLTKSRSALASENKLYRTQLTGSFQGSDLTLEQQARLQSSLEELKSRTVAAELEVKQLERQLSQNELQLANAKNVLVVNERIFNDLKPLMKDGGISRIQFLRQQQEVGTRQAEVNQLLQEEERLRFAIAQAKEKQQNTVSLSKKDLFSQIADNEKKLAEIDGQLNKAMVENDKRLAEIKSQLSQAQLTLKYQEIRSPVNGVVFELQAHTPGFVATTSEPILKIVPSENLIAKIFITNKDIGFVKAEDKMQVDVRIDSFPFSEFGDIKGELISIGSDALPPTEIRPFYSFPAKIRLDQQFIMINGRQMPLQSGMSLSANIKVRKRPVISIFTDLFIQKIESLKFVR